MQTQQYMSQTIEFKKQIEQLILEKSSLNDKYQKQLQQVLREKEELTINQDSLEDKLQKIDLDREQLKLQKKNI